MQLNAKRDGVSAKSLKHKMVSLSPERFDKRLALQQMELCYLDAQLGYRLPKRFGMVTFQISNILDQKFDFQDDSFRDSQDSPSIGPYIPQRQAMLYLTLNW